VIRAQHRVTQATDQSLNRSQLRGLDPLKGVVCKGWRGSRQQQ